MSKLHELLAVESNHEAAATKLIAETVATFKNKENLFKGKTRTLMMFGKDDTNRIEFEALEAKDAINIPVAATVPGNLNYLAAILADYYDVVAQKEFTNQTAKADLIVDGKILIKDAPATYLLGLETKLKALRPSLEEIPTMTPAVKWVPANDLGDWLYRSDEVAHDIKTAKTQDFRLLPQPNPANPSNFQTIEIVKNIGEYKESVTSGLINTSDKARVLERLDNLLKAVKQARQRANSVETINVKPGDELMKYLFGAWFDRSKVNPGARI